jgi:hypothetical protein
MSTAETRKRLRDAVPDTAEDKAEAPPASTSSRKPRGPRKNVSVAEFVALEKAVQVAWPASAHDFDRLAAEVQRTARGSLLPDTNAPLRRPHTIRRMLQSLCSNRQPHCFKALPSQWADLVARIRSYEPSVGSTEPSEDEVFTEDDMSDVIVACGAAFVAACHRHNTTGAVQVLAVFAAFTLDRLMDGSLRTEGGLVDEVLELFAVMLKVCYSRVAAMHDGRDKNCAKMMLIVAGVVTAGIVDFLRDDSAHDDAASDASE